jgi:hypothetical protein
VKPSPTLPRTLVSVITSTSSHDTAALTLTQTVTGLWLLVRVADQDTHLELDRTAAQRLGNALLEFAGVTR